MIAPDTIFTYYDIVSRLLERQSLDGTPREIASAKMAVSDAIRELANMFGSWKWYNRRFMITASASVSLAVTYDATGGAQERLVTITSGTAPADIEYGCIVYNNKIYDIGRKISSTTFTLADYSAPTTDFSGTVVWGRDRYFTPNTIRNVNEVWCTSRSRMLSPYPEAKMTSFQRIASRIGSPYQYTITSSKNKLGLFEIRLSPIPDIADTFEINAYFNPKPLVVFDVTGFDGVVNNGVVTSASNPFKQEHVGCILRLSPDTNPPKGRWISDEDRSEYKSQHIITKFVNSGQIEIDNAPANTSGVGFSISDYVDIDPDTHLELLELTAMEKFMRSKNYEDSDIAMARLAKQSAITQALEANSKVNWNLEYGNYPTLFDSSLIYRTTLHKNIL